MNMIIENGGPKDNLCKVEVIARVLGEFSGPGQLLDEEGDLQSVPSGDVYPLARGERLALLCKACQSALRCLVVHH